MSAIRKSTTTTTASKKPHCKVCQDAGKSEKEYTSHYVRSMPDRTGKTVVTCPTLLATECRFCFEAGHTTKFCPVIAKNKKEEAKRNYKEANKNAEEEKNKPKMIIGSNKLTKFSALDMGNSSEDEEEPPRNHQAKTKTQTQTKNIQQEQKEEFPALLSSKAAPTSTVAAHMTSTSGWASIAAKTPEQYESEKYEQELLERSIKRQNPTPAPAPVKKVVCKIPEPSFQKKSWADYSSDEEEEAAFEEAYQQVVKEKMMKQQQYCDEDW